MTSRCVFLPAMMLMVSTSALYAAGFTSPGDAAAGAAMPQPQQQVPNDNPSNGQLNNSAPTDNSKSDCSCHHQNAQPNNDNPSATPSPSN